MNLFGLWVRLLMLFVFVGTPLHFAMASEPNNSITEKDWVKFGSDVSLSLASLAEKSASKVLDKAWMGAVSEGSLLLFTKLGQFLPEDVAKKVLSDPQKLAQIMNDSASNAFNKNITATDIGALALGVVTDSFVNFIREEWHSKNAYEEGVKELGVLMIREAGMGYALETKGVPWAIVAQAMISGKTVVEALQAGAALYKQNKENDKLEAQNAIGNQFLKLRAELKAETDNIKKKQLLSQVDQLLQDEGSFLFAGSNDSNQARKNYIEILAKNSGLSISTPQPIERQAASTNALGLPPLDMRTANTTPAMSSALMQNQLTAITQGGSSHIGSAAYFMGRSPSQDFVRESSNTVAHIPTIRETSQVTNGFIIQAPVDIVLTWGATPRDLDSHLTGPAAADGTRFHTYFAARGDLNAAPNVMLYRDVTTGTGPEQTRINVVQPGVYRFYVHDYTNQDSVNSTALSNSGAVVAVHAAGSFNLPEGNNLGAEVARVSVPTNQVGTAWQAFELDSRTGILNKTTTFRNIADSASVPFNQ